MSSFGSLRLGGNAPRRLPTSGSPIAFHSRTSRFIPRRSYHSRHMANHICRMTATPVRNNRLWHPARGILFSLAAPSAPMPPPARPLRPAAGRSFGVGQYRSVVTSQSVDAQSEALDTLTTPPVSQPASADIEAQSSAENAAESASDPAVAEPNVPESAEAKRNQDANRNPALKNASKDLPPAVLDYQMVRAMFYAAKQAEPGSVESFWSYSMYRSVGEDGSETKPIVHYCRSTQTMERVCQYFKDEKVLGFDLEWVTDPRQPEGLKKCVSLIQIASASRIALFHVALFPEVEDMAGPTFRSIMENPEITKCGVAIRGDAARLRKYLDINSQGLFELSHLYKLVTYSRNRKFQRINKKLVPLAQLVEEFLHLPMSKGSVRSGNWAKRLNMEQVKYSASDAYAGLHLFATLDHHRTKLDPCPPRPHHAELARPIEWIDGTKVGLTDEEPDGQEVDDEVQLPRKFKLVKDNVKADQPDVIENGSDDAVVNSFNKVLIGHPKIEKVTEKTPKDPRVEICDAKAIAHFEANPQGRLNCTVAPLRAYFLWHCYDLSPQDVGALLRDPPLKNSTVISYIVQAVETQRLPVDPDRYTEVVAQTPRKLIFKNSGETTTLRTTTLRQALLRMGPE